MARQTAYPLTTLSRRLACAWEMAACLLLQGVAPTGHHTESRPLRTCQPRGFCMSEAGCLQEGSALDLVTALAQQQHSLSEQAALHIFCQVCLAETRCILPSKHQTLTAGPTCRAPWSECMAMSW